MQAQMSFCQSCGMPMQQGSELFGTEKNGTKSTEYCSYCYENGEFLANCTMDEMIAFSAAPMAESNPEMSVEKATEMMRAFFPTLKRWRIK